MSVAKENLASLQKVMNYIHWYLKQSPRDLIEHYKTHQVDARHTLNWSGRGVIIGRGSALEFRKIVERFFSAHPQEQARVDTRKFEELLREEFCSRFLKLGQELNEKFVDRMVSSAYRKCLKELEAIRHFIPCDVFLARDTNEFTVGPVQFIHRRKFIETHREEIDAHRISIQEQHKKTNQKMIEDGWPADKLLTQEQSEKIANRLVDDLLRFYDRYDWIAVVDIPPSHPDISREKAIFAAKAALNAVKLLLGEYHADRLRTAYDAAPPREAAELTRGKNGLNVSLSMTPGGNVGGDEKLKLLTGEFADYAALAGGTIALLIQEAVPPPLCVRFTDALNWFGEAVSESSPGAKIVKFVTAIERMTGTGFEVDSNGEQRSTTEIVANRSAVFCYESTKEDILAYKDRLRRIYDLRSNLVHGSISPFDDSVRKACSEAEELSGYALFMGLQFFSTLGIAKLHTEAHLKKQFTDLEIRYKLLPSVPEAPSS